MWKRLKLSHETWKWAVRRRHCSGSPLCVLPKGAFSKGQPHDTEMGISQHENPVQLSCRTSHHIQQMEHDGENPSGLRTQISAMNIIQVINGEKKIKMLRKSMGLKLQGWVGHMESWQWHCSAGCPQLFYLDEEALSILNTGMRAALSCSHHGKRRKKKFILLQVTFCTSEKIYFLLCVFSEANVRTDWQVFSGQAVEVCYVKHSTRATKQ